MSTARQRQCRSCDRIDEIPSYAPECSRVYRGPLECTRCSGVLQSMWEYLECSGVCWSTLEEHGEPERDREAWESPQGVVP